MEAPAKSDAKSASREGWLMKKGQKRYFILSNRTLSWKSHPLSGEVKKSIAVHQCDIEFGESQEVPTILIKPSVIAEPTFNIQYELEAKDWAEANEWLESLRLASSKGQDNKSAFGKEGWLEKKGKKRWFLLHKDNGVLYWFSKEQDHDADFIRNVKGQLSTSVMTDVSPVVTGTLNKQKPAFRISTSIPGLEYILTAKTWSEMVEWISAVHTCGINATPAKSAPTFTGYLMKKGKRRFFILERDSPTRSRLSWYSNEKNSTVLGGISLEGCLIELVRDKCSLVIAMPNGKRYELIAKSQQEACDWHAHLVEGASKESQQPQGDVNVRKDSKAAKQGWLLKKGQRRYFVFTDDTLMWFVNEPDNSGDWMKHIKGSLTLGPGCHVGTTHNAFAFYVETARGYTYQLTAASAREAAEWIEVLRSRLAIRSSRQPEPTKEDGPASNRNSAHSDWRAASVPGPGSGPGTPGSSPPKYSSKICNLLGDVPTLDNVVVQAGWLTKKGKRRWFLLTSLGELLWYEREHPMVPLDVKPKGMLSLVGCSTKERDELSFIIFSPWGQSYTLTDSTAKKKELWLSSLKLGIQKANLMEDKLAADTQIVKTGWLEKKGKRRWFALIKKDKELLWFANPHPRYKITTGHAKGSLALPGCSLERTGNTVNIGGTKILTLIAGSTQEAEEWVTALGAVQAT